MKIYFSGIEISAGKTKYNDARLDKLADKFKPKKIVPFFPEFITSGPVQADAIVLTKDKLLDILIPDIEKFESRISNSDSGEEKKLAEKCLAALGEEKPLCDINFSDEERALLAGLAPLSFKPVIIAEKGLGSNDVIALALKKTGIMFFYTVGKDECKAWPAEENSDAITCAGKIHSDLAKGFIKADVINYNDFADVYNMREAKDKGLVKTVDRNYIIHDGDIIEIRFNVSKKT